MILLKDFLERNASPSETVLMYPEMGAVHFIVDRPYVGRFASATLAWLSEDWYREWLAQLQTRKPRFAVVLKQMPEYFQFCYFTVASNQQKFIETTKFIRDQYMPVDETPSWIIYRLKGTP